MYIVAHSFNTHRVVPTSGIENNYCLLHESIQDVAKRQIMNVILIKMLSP